MKLDLIQPIQEGVHDPYIFKAVFMAGAPGSGKSTVLRELFGGTGMKLIDADEIRRAHLDMGKGSDYETYGKIVRKQRSNFALQRLGLLMDTTAWWAPSIVETKHQLEDLGYDVGMVHVYAPLQTSLERVKARAEVTGRVVPEEEVVKRYEGLRNNLRDYGELFGDAFWFVDNTRNRPNMDLVRNHLKSWLRQPPRNPAANLWISQQIGRNLKESAPVKKISAGVVVTDGKRVVLGHVTGQSHWDLPKGGVDSGESLERAAVRELREETGIQAPVSKLEPLGTFNYSQTKNLALFLLRVDQMPAAHDLHCTSMFTAPDGRRLPEMDDFAVVTWDEAAGLINNNNLLPIWRKIKSRIVS